jgi:hypothetical protein
MRWAMGDGRQRHEVRGLNIKCGPWVGSICHTEVQRITDASGNDRVARAVTAEEEDPRGGDAGLNRVRYRYRLLLHIFVLLPVHC